MRVQRNAAVAIALSDAGRPDFALAETYAAATLWRARNPKARSRTGFIQPSRPTLSKSLPQQICGCTIKHEAIANSAVRDGHVR